VKCAAFELPFHDGETFGIRGIGAPGSSDRGIGAPGSSDEDLQAVLTVLGEEGFVHFADGQWNWTSESYPADAVSLRSISSDNFVVVDRTPGQGERVIGETNFTSGPATLHEKAIYLVEGQLFQVERLDFDGRKAYVRAVECDYYTDAITYTRVTILDVFEGTRHQALGTQPEAPARHEEPTRHEALPGHEARGPHEARGTRHQALRSHGEVHVVSRVVGFKKIKFYTNENVGSGELDLPEQQMHTTAYWLTIPREVMAALPHASDDRRDGVVGLAWAMKNVAQLLLMCDRHDIGLSIDGGSSARGQDDVRSVRTGGAAAPPSEIGAQPNVFIYDNYPGGIGFSQPLFAMHETVVARTRDLLAGCPCESGCPSCVGPEGHTGPLAKTVASRILDMLVTGAAS
ncbi:MAG: Zn-binding domain-containing protein, partial [Vicinamibacterales bacterium]